MPERFPFSIGLDVSQIEVSGPEVSVSSNLNATFSDNATGYNGANIGLSEPELQDGVFVSDTSLKQVYIPMTVFQSFPVQMENGSYTYITDSCSTGDNAGTNIGQLSQSLNGGVCGFPDKFDKGILQSQTNSVNAFKVGASVGYMYGDNYFQHYYPEVDWKTGRGGDFLKLKRNNCLTAEVVIPTSSSEGRPVRINLVDDGPYHLFAIDVMGAYCLLDEVKDLFKIQAKDNEGWKLVGNEKIKFPFASGKYDYINGEIPGYSPSAVLSYRENLYNKNGATPFMDYSGAIKAGPKNKKGHSLVRVRFFIDPKNKEKAEKLVKKTLHEELFKTNYQGETVQIQPINAVDRAVLSADNSTISERILNAGIKVSSYLVSVQEGYDQSGRELIPASRKGLSNFKWVSKHGIDCSSSVAWILAEAGLVDFGNKSSIWAANTGIWRQYKSSWPNKELPLAKGFKGIPVPIAEVQPGDIVLHDKNKSSNNHVLIYAGPGQILDFGCTAYCNRQQPLSKSHLKDVPGGCWAWRIVPNDSAQT